MRVSEDKYSLPEIVADDVYELSQMCGASVNTIRATIWHYKQGHLKKERYVRVMVEDTDG